MDGLAAMTVHLGIGSLLAREMIALGWRVGAKRLEQIEALGCSMKRLVERLVVRTRLLPNKSLELTAHGATVL